MFIEIDMSIDGTNCPFCGCPHAITPTNPKPPDVFHRECINCSHIFFIKRHVNWETGEYSKRFIVNYQDWEDYIDMEIPVGPYAPALLYDPDDAWLIHKIYMEGENVKSKDS